jgi:ribosomal protein S21
MVVRNCFKAFKKQFKKIGIFTEIKNERDTLSQI